jgi:DNA-binding MarR family transcriptional regulator
MTNPVRADALSSTPSADPRLLAELDRLLTQLATVVEIAFVRRPLEAAIGDDDVTAAQLRTLRLLSGVPGNTPGLMVGAIAEGLRISYPAATKAVDRLTDRGLAERHRDASDARQIMVRLTTKGREVVARVAAERQATLHAVLQDLGGDVPARSLAALLEAFVARSVRTPEDLEEVQRESGI